VAANHITPSIAAAPDARAKITTPTACGHRWDNGKAAPQQQAADGDHHARVEDRVGRHHERDGARSLRGSWYTRGSAPMGFSTPGWSSSSNKPFTSTLAVFSSLFISLLSKTDS
jgi:hypothetical protein